MDAATNLALTTIKNHLSQLTSMQAATVVGRLVDELTDDQLDYISFGDDRNLVTPPRQIP